MPSETTGAGAKDIAVAPVAITMNIWSVAVHAGAGVPDFDSLNAHKTEALHAGVRDALRAASAVLMPPCPPPPPDPLLANVPLHLAAAVAAVRTMESNALFNAGRGSVLTASGAIETEAAVMDGAAMRIGAVAGLSTVVHPVELALLVRMHAPHNFLGFAGAEAFADGFAPALARAPNNYFRTSHRVADLTRLRPGGIEHAGGGTVAASSPSSPPPPPPGETVGAVVCAAGHLACATSTGGVTGKLDGRLGDTSVIGAGSYADARLALSATGVGEEFLRWNAAGRVAALVEYAGRPAGTAMREVVDKCFPPNAGGFIGVDVFGEVHFAFNSPYMARGSLKSSAPEEAYSALWANNITEGTNHLQTR